MASECSFLHFFFFHYCDLLSYPCKDFDDRGFPPEFFFSLFTCCYFFPLAVIIRTVLVSVLRCKGGGEGALICAGWNCNMVPSLLKFTSFCFVCFLQN